jgi:UDP-N-acetylglucosamine 2-epimerase
LYRLNHFAPTELAKQNLFAEGVMSDEIHVTGNTIVDSLRFMIAKIADDRELQLRIAERFPILTPGRKLVLVTGHRRESFGPGFERIYQALRRIAERGDEELESARTSSGSLKKLRCRSESWPRPPNPTRSAHAAFLIREKFWHVRYKPDHRECRRAT